MQHTLIPYKERRKLHREYSLRVVGVSLFIISVALLTGAAAIFPSYLYASIHQRAAKDAINSLKQSKVDQGLDKARNELIADDKLLKALLSTDNDIEYSFIVESIVMVRGNASISTFDLSMPATSSVSIGISGSAPTRNDLLALRGRLEELFAGAKIDIPIEQLARSTNLPFSLNFTHKTK